MTVTGTRSGGLAHHPELAHAAGPVPVVPQALSPQTPCPGARLSRCRALNHPGILESSPCSASIPSAPSRGVLGTAKGVTGTEDGRQYLSQLNPAEVLPEVLAQLKPAPGASPVWPGLGADWLGL